MKLKVSSKGSKQIDYVAQASVNYYHFRVNLR
jgi:hypothetical protein